jgi:hypothetical protein
MAQNDEQQSASKRQNTLHQRRSARTSQDQYGGQEGTNPSGNQDQFHIDDVAGQYGSSRDQPGPFNSEELYHKAPSRRPGSPRGRKQKRTES